MPPTEKIKKFWDDQARRFGIADIATAPDTHYRSLEIDRIMHELRDRVWALDVGCGNGYSTIRFAQKFPHLKISGIDYSEEMIRQARRALAKHPLLKKRVHFSVGNVMSLSDVHAGQEKFDLIISERCLINLNNWGEQKKALLEMKQILKSNGKIILCENTQEGLARLNQLRKDFQLRPIATRWHNYYMPEKKLIAFAKKHFSVEKIINIGSLYYIISRVVYAKLSDIVGEKPQYLHPINNIASCLPSLGNFSPNFIFVLKNTTGKT